MNTPSKNKKRRRGLHSFRNPQSAFRIGTFRLPPSPLRPALTLIELMVVIVILMTLVGGVIPVLSPNNEARKIRDASRGLQTYVMQAQARAARSGRPVGIAFRETSPGSGVALEVFQIEIPPPFAGFSSASSARFYRNRGLNGEFLGNYTIELGEGYVLFNPNVGHVPPLFAKPGDLIEVGDHLFSLKRGKRGTEWELDDNNVPYFVSTNTFTDAWPADDQYRPFPRDPNNPTKSSPNRYRIVRQPVNTSESPYTLPAGVAIDMYASGTEGGVTPTLFARARYPQSTIKQIGIMFSPSGGIDSIYYNGTVVGSNSTSLTKSVKSPITDASRVFLLLGRVENVLVNMASSEMEIRREASDEQLAELQERINWLNLDSRWIVFDARSGRSVVTENTFVDARRLNLERYSQIHAKVRLPWAQLDAARQLARQMRSGGGR